jgi:UDP-3-O-[3-hydroxymyristoyl] glucosamine N-acyltransferase
VEFVTIDAAGIADYLRAELIGTSIKIHQVTQVNEPVDGALAFLVAPHVEILEKWEGISGALIAPVDAKVPSTCVHIISSNPRKDYAAAVRQFFAPPREVGISDTAVIHSSALIGTGAFIGNHVVIEAGVVIGNGVSVGHNTTVLKDVVIGNDVSVGHNSVIGSVGFGLEEDENGEWVRIPHLGNVVIEDGVEVGSSTVIARGTIKETRIGRNCKIDDNVFIAHNVRIGFNSVVIANAEVSGSVEIGENCWIGPAVTILEKIKIGDGAMVGLGSVVIRDVPMKTVVVGNPGKILRAR